MAFCSRPIPRYKRGCFLRMHLSRLVLCIPILLISKFGFDLRRDRLLLSCVGLFL